MSPKRQKQPDKPTRTKANQKLLPDVSALERSAGLFKSLSNPHRLQILMLLRKGEMDVGHIQEALNISQPLASQHLKALKQYNLLSENRKGKHVYYSLRSVGISKALMGFIQLQTMELAAETEALASLNELMSFWV